MTQQSVQGQLDDIQQALKHKASNGGSLYGKLAAAALIPTLAALVGYGALQERVDNNQTNISTLNDRVSDARSIAIETQRDVAVIKSRQQKRLKLLQEYTDALDEVRNSQAQYVGEITAKLQTTAEALAKAAESLEDRNDQGPHQ